MATPHDDATEIADLSSEPQDLAATLLAARHAYMSRLAESAEARKRLDADIEAARADAEHASQRFAPEKALLSRFSSAWQSYGERDEDPQAIARARRESNTTTPATLEDAERLWAACADRCRDELERYRQSRTTWENARKPIFRKAAPEPRLPKTFQRDLATLREIDERYAGLRDAWVDERLGDATRRLRAAFETEAVERDQRMLQMLDGAMASVRLGVELLGISGQSWDTLLATPIALSSGPRSATRLGSIASGLPQPYAVDVPCVLSFPSDRGLAIEAPIRARQAALDLTRSVVLRVLLDIPPGQLRLSMIDPTAIGQTFAEFVHLGDYDERLIDTAIKTSQQSIERSLAEHAAHLETVISKYLRGQFGNIHDYNRHAGEMAEPFRLVVIADYPRQFTERAQEQLLSLVENGPRCGVYCLILYAPEDETARNVPFVRLTKSMDLVTWKGTAPSVRVQEAPTPIDFTPDRCPPISFGVDGKPTSPAGAAVDAIGREAKRGNDTVVSLDNFLPVLNRNRAGVLPDFRADAPALSLAPETWWTASTADMAVAPIGRTGAQGVASMYFSSTTVAGGAIMVGLPRSGKTTSLHAMIMTMAMLYSPDELELYLIDAKHGVEFKTYESLPHARMVSIHSDREFSLAVLQSIQSKIRERAELIKTQGSGLSNITEYRKATGEKLARIVVVVDEFHEIFEEPDQIGMQAFAAFSDIVRMGPFSGVHVVVASQTLSSMPAMDRQTLTLLPQRVAFMCNEYDAEIVMGDSNRAVRMLSKTGEGLFNPSRGDESKNQPFQGLYITPDQRSLLLRELRDKAEAEGWRRYPRVFDGDAVVPRPTAITAETRTGTRLAVPIGEPFTLADSEVLVLSRTRGANVLLLGDRDDEERPDLALRGVLHSLLLAGQHQSVATTVVDFVSDEELPRGLTVMEVAEAVGARYVRSTSLAHVLTDIAGIVASRTAAEEYKAPTQLLILRGLQRALSIVPFDQYAVADEDEPPALSTMLAAVLMGGPEVGVHVVIDADRGRSVEMRIGQELLSELTIRIAGSSADQKDLALVSGSYGDISAPRAGQLLIGDIVRGSAKRARGYELLTTISTAT